ncbi:N-acetylglucosamine-6-phosphate deacetylase [Symmachiella macrocystis]|uniref:N-acetylglucosamine-6-phosphate deacetylase n=1 Tax=Symmachiella macrocystis TaxID=2527985 RepID=A0A5C6BQ32_9PLAN|nr:amidohydrolase family protein [Symmachiella macrocystis]TWU12724.1 N-acetylglucosamine-6-phosphate deacetylase [Symmachiella macrocystis]
MFIEGRRYDTGEPVRISIDQGRIATIEPARPTGPIEEWPYVAPGMFDLQINGHGGIWYSQPGLTAEDIIGTLVPHFAHGVTRMFPTLVTNSFENLASGFTAIRQACDQEAWVAEMAPGCHLEGPYISREDGPRGAHGLEYVRDADWDEFSRLQEISGNRIKLLTLAPEVPGAIELIRRAVKSGVTVSIGHTAATPEDIRAAADAGATLSTHLGNGAHGMLRRHPNYIWEQLAEDRLHTSIICDGHHLPASVVKTILRVKSPQQTILTCDAAGLAGCPPGEYRNAGVDVEVLADGRIVIAGQDQLLAGSTLCTDACVANAMRLGGVSLKEAIDMAGRVPARLVGLETIELLPGSRADLITFHVPPESNCLDIRATLFGGEFRHGG